MSLPKITSISNIKLMEMENEDKRQSCHFDSQHLRHFMSILKNLFFTETSTAIHFF